MSIQQYVTIFFSFETKRSCDKIRNMIQHIRLKHYSPEKKKRKKMRQNLPDMDEHLASKKENGQQNSLSGLVTNVQIEL